MTSYANDGRFPFDPDANKMARIEAAGHSNRTGHELTGFYREIEEGIFRLIRTCACKDN